VLRPKPWLTFVAGNLTGAAVVAAMFLIGPLAGPQELEPGKLVILSGRDDSDGGQRQQLINLWNDSHPHNQASIVTVPAASDGQFAEMTGRAQDDGTDIFNLDSTWTAFFADPPSGRRLIRPIDEARLAEKPGDAFMKGPLDTCRYDRKLWALPFNTDAGLLYYRLDQRLEPPFDWASIRAAGQSRHGFEAAWTSQLNNYEGLTVNMLETVWSLGGDLKVDGNGRVTLDLAKWNAAVKLLTPPPQEQHRLILPHALESYEDGSRDDFADGRVLFMRNWPVSYRLMQSGDRPAQAGKPVFYGVAQLPGGSVLGGQNLAISERTKKPRAAQALIEFLTGDRAQTNLFVEGGFAATRAGVYEDEAIKQKYQAYLPQLREALGNARLRPISPNYVAFSQRLSEEVYLVLTRQRAALPADFADQLTAALQGR
jgi:ABC-type glycerol-3-phosphate transport system substrate-binding protein